MKECVVYIFIQHSSIINFSTLEHQNPGSHSVTTEQFITGADLKRHKIIQTTILTPYPFFKQEPIPREHYQFPLAFIVNAKNKHCLTEVVAMLNFNPMLKQRRKVLVLEHCARHRNVNFDTLQSFIAQENFLMVVECSDSYTNNLETLQSCCLLIGNSNLPYYYKSDGQLHQVQLQRSEAIIAERNFFHYLSRLKKLFQQPQQIVQGCLPKPQKPHYLVAAGHAVENRLIEKKCPVCLGVIDLGVTEPCNHKICALCATVLLLQDNKSCPECRQIMRAYKPPG